MPRRPARPVSWVYSPGVIGTRASPLNFSSFSSTTVRAGMLMPSASVSVAKTALHQLALEELLDDFLECGEHSGVVCGDAAFQPLEPLPVAEHREILVAQGAAAFLDDGADLVAFAACSVRRTPACSTFATALSHPLRLKMKKIAGSRFFDSSRRTRSRPVDPRAGSEPPRPLVALGSRSAVPPWCRLALAAPAARPPRRRAAPAPG